MKKVLFFSVLITFFGCDNMLDEILKPKYKIDKLFVNGFNMQLEQVYVISVNNVILDTLFKGGTTVVDINDFTSLNNTVVETYYQPMLLALSKDEIWRVSKHIVENYNTTENLSVGTTIYTYTHPHTYQYNTVTCDNDYTNRKFIIGFIPEVSPLGLPPEYRGFRMINDSLNKGDNYISSNLWPVSNEKNGYIYFDTNNIVKMTYQVSKPLTGDEVKSEIAKGNYTLYLYNNLTTYKIGDNLYIPRYNSYVYIACVAGNGGIMSYSNTYYRLIFKVLN